MDPSGSTEGPAIERPARRRLGPALGRIRSGTAHAIRRVLLYAVIAGASVVAGLIVVNLYAEYGYHPIRNAATWASQPVRYAVGGECAGCHSVQVAAIAERSHAGTDCQSCHGPRADHARTGSVTLTSTTAASPAACLVCHERVVGRPLAFPVVTAASHFGAAPCVLCHEPHATVAKAPPRVPHVLDGLPACLVCHGPDGLRPMPAEHPDWPEGDCLGCHLRRGALTP